MSTNCFGLDGDYTQNSPKTDLPSTGLCKESPEKTAVVTEHFINPKDCVKGNNGRERNKVINQITDQLFLSQVIDLLGPEPNQALASLSRTRHNPCGKRLPRTRTHRKRSRAFGIIQQHLLLPQPTSPHSHHKPKRRPMGKRPLPSHRHSQRHPTTNPNSQNPSPLHRRSRQKPLHSRVNNRPAIQHATQPSLPNRKTSPTNNT